MEDQTSKTKPDGMVAATQTSGDRTDLTNATTILGLLGGPEFIRTTGARNLIGSTRELQMTIATCGRSRKTINSVVIRLEADGKYRMWLGRHYQKGTTVHTTSEHDGVPPNELQALFGRETGLTIQARRAGPQRLAKASPRVKLSHPHGDS